jgi:hypothetical protein
MTGKGKEPWRELCEQAANEYDPQKFHELIVDINRLLEQRERQLLQQSISGTSYAGTQPKHCKTRARADAGHL